jgi:hypothetical protein
MAYNFRINMALASRGGFRQSRTNFETKKMGRRMRPGLEPLTPRLKNLPLDDRGYPVPWFVGWIDGKPDFRTADSEKWLKAVQFNLCWVCGGQMGAHKCFVIGPMCGLNRNTSEPPCHLDCAQWSARNCPFLSNPNMVRNERNLVGDNPGGIMIKRNPGVTLLWNTKSYRPYNAGNGILITIGEPTSIEFYTEGRKATVNEIHDAIESGCPILEKVATEDGPASLKEFTIAKHKFLTLIERHVS